MAFWFDYEVERQRRLDEAARAAAGRDSAWQEYVFTTLPAPRYQRAVVAVGGLLVRLGTALQQRYANLSALPEPTYPDPISRTQTGGC